MTWYEVVLFLLFFGLLAYCFYLVIKDERKRTAAFVKKEIAQRQFYKYLLLILPKLEFCLEEYCKQFQECMCLNETMNKSMEDIENV